MSHRPERKEKDCLNCGAEVYGKYCHVCGQENVEPKENAWHLVTHFAYDISHFDGKFFRSVKALLLKPGFLSQEYLKGRRMNYLNPVPMYVFTSAIFFVFFFSVVKPEKSIVMGYTAHTVADTKQVLELSIQDLELALKDSSKPAKTMKNRQKLAWYQKDVERLKTDTTHLDELNIFKDKGIHFSSTESYKSFREYDSAQQLLPASKRNGWVKRKFVEKELEIQDKYGHDPKGAVKTMGDIFFHSFPKLLFISLPLFALLLKLIYIRRKQFYYIDHAIYAIHLYCAMFVLIFLLACVAKTQGLPYIGWIYYTAIGLLIYMCWYVYRSMRQFYQQRRGKTIFKFFTLMFISTFMMVFLFMVFFIFSIFSI